MNITPTNNTSFQGYLNLTGIKTNNARWKSVAKCFSEKSKHFPNAEIRVCTIKDEMALEACLNTKEGWKNDITAAMFTFRFQEFFENLSDNDIAGILVKFIKLGNLGKNELSKTRKFISSVVQKLKHDSAISKETFDVFYKDVLHFF